ncbi:PAP2 family protein, partial [Klebsiella pneumoniae]|nr:PAP2 family protein [Klebsiella pneumoniae]
MKRYRHLYLLSCTLLICFVALSLSYHTACIEKFDDVV